MTKFIVGVVVGIFLGASVGAYGSVAARPGTSSGWAVALAPKAIKTCGHNQIVPDPRHRKFS